MALPKYKQPTFTLILPSNKSIVRYRAFTVKEEKILLTAQVDGSEEVINHAIKQVINNCLLTELDVETLPMFDIEYIYMKLRAKSVNNVVEFVVTDEEDQKKYKFEVDLDKVEMIYTPEHTTKIQLDGDLCVIMRYPTAKITEKIKSLKLNELDSLFALIAECIDTVYDDDTVYKAGSDFTTEDAISFVDNLSKDAFKRIENFFETAPRLEYTYKYTNSLGNEKEVKITGLAGFFT